MARLELEKDKKRYASRGQQRVWSNTPHATASAAMGKREGQQEAAI